MNLPQTTLVSVTCCSMNISNQLLNTTDIDQLHIYEVLQDAISVFGGIVDQQDWDLFGIVGMVTICSFFIILGVTTNTINLIIFYKIGFKETINISLFALAISDMLSCLFMVPVVVAINPFISDTHLPVNRVHFSNTIGALGHLAFAKITTLITAFITFERCLCVFTPLKVKRIITRKRVVVYLISSYLSMLSLIGSAWYAHRLGWTFSPIHNRTILGLVFPDDREDIENVGTPITTFVSVFSFAFIIISTSVLVTTLKKKAKWRLEATSAGNTDTSPVPLQKDNNNITDTKERRITKMVVMISTLFIVCFFPSSVTLLIIITDNRFYFDGQYTNLFFIIITSAYIVEIVNSSTNIFIYYHNSSNYKAMFGQIFLSRPARKR